MKRSMVWIIMLSVVGGWATGSLAQTDADLKALLQKVTVLTCINPPAQMQEEGQPLTGVAVELVQMVLQEAGVQSEIQVYPWARAYDMAQKTENVMLFTIIRNPQREKLFKWVGSLYPFQAFLYRLKERPEIVVQTLADAKKYRVGSQQAGSITVYLQSQGFNESNLDLTQFASQNIQKLFARRIDLYPTDPIVLAYWLRTMNNDPSLGRKFDPTQLEQIFHIEGADGEMYIALSPQTADRVVEHFRQALDRVKARPQYQQLLDKYLK
jgi:polar amino acid transport system substrate-binding protein